MPRVPAPGSAAAAGERQGAGSTGASQATLPSPRLRPLWQCQVQRLLQRVLPVQTDLWLVGNKKAIPATSFPEMVLRPKHLTVLGVGGWGET